MELLAIISFGRVPAKRVNSVDSSIGKLDNRVGMERGWVVAVTTGDKTKKSRLIEHDSNLQRKERDK